MKKLPIFGSVGPKVVRWVYVDEDSYKKLHAFKWMTNKNGSIFRYIDGDKGPKRYLGHQILGKTPQSMYSIKHVDGDEDNYCRENLMAEKREE